MTILRVLKVRLHEEINGQDRVFQPGEIFQHPDDERAKVLLGVTPPTVKVPNDADYIEYAKYALEQGVEIADYIGERLKEIKAKRGGKKGAKADAKPKTSRKAAGGDKPEEADEE